MESKVDSKLRAVCATAKVYEDAAEKSMAALADVYSATRRVVISRHVDELRSVEEAQGLARNLTLLRKRSSRLSLHLKKLQADVQEQTEELYRTEVDVDMKLRACRGSCRTASPFSVDHHGYQALGGSAQQMDQVLTQKRTAGPPEVLPVLKLQPVDPQTGPAVLRDLFEDIDLNQVVLEDLD